MLGTVRKFFFGFWRGDLQSSTTANMFGRHNKNSQTGRNLMLSPIVPHACSGLTCKAISLTGLSVFNSPKRCTQYI